MTLEELQILITSETSGLKKELANVKKELGSVDKEVKATSNSIKNAFKSVAAVLATLGIGTAIRSATKEAMVFEASIQQIQRLMGNSAKAFQEWADKNAIGFGMARAEAIRYGAVYANLISSFTTSTAQTTQYTQDLLQASAVVASSTGRSLEDVMERIRSGLLGNTEAIEDLGINVNIAMIESTEAFKRFANGRSWQQLNYQTQQTILYYAILEQAARKYGNELAQNTSTRQAAFVAQLKDAQLALGQAFLPIYNVVLPALTDLAAALANVLRYVAAFSQAFFGTNQAIIQQATNAAKAQANVGAAFAQSGKQAEKAGEKAQGAVASFDEVHQIDLPSGSDTGAGAAPTAGGVTGEPILPEIDTSGPPKQIQEMANQVKKIFSDLQSGISDYGQKVALAFAGVIPALQPIIDAKEPIMAAFQEIGRTAGELVDRFLRPVADYLVMDFVPSIVVSFIQSFAPVFANTAVWAVQEFAKTFQNVTDILANLWGGVWRPAADDIKIAFTTAFPEIANSVQSVLDGTIKPFTDYILNGFALPIFDQLNQTLVPIFSDTLVWAIKEFTNSFSWAAGIMNEIYHTIIQPVFDLIKTIVMDTLQVIQNLWQKHGQTLLNNLSQLFANIRNTFQLLWDNVLTPIIQPFLETLSWLWDEHLKGMIKQVGDFVMILIDDALEIYNKFISPIIDWLIKNFGPAFSQTFNTVVKVVGDFVAMIADVVKGIFKVLGGVIDFITGVFTGNWTKAWEGVRSIFKGIMDSLWGIIKFPLNLIIDGINTVIDGLNSIRIDVPDWVPGLGGQKWGINIPKIPKLASGGIVDRPTIAMIGEAGKEAVLPLERDNVLADSIGQSVYQAVLTAMRVGQAGSPQSGGDREIVLRIDGATFARAVLPSIIREGQRQGLQLVVRPQGV